jgi:hypothetical protein
MSLRVSSGIIGFVAGTAVAVAAAQTPQPQPQPQPQSLHQHPTAPPEHNRADRADQMRDIMMDPVKHKQMMERMTQCRDMMSMMMDHMRHQQLHSPPSRQPR